MATSPQHYMSGSGEPLVLPSYCVYADLLGLRHRIQACKTKAATVALCKQIHGLFEGVSDDLGEQFNSAENAQSYQFISDGLFLGAPTDDWGDDADLGFPVMDIAYAQLRLVLAGFPIRGGLTFGDLHISERLVFGPSAIEAYELETKRAIYPRIVVSDEVLSDAARHVRYYAKPDLCPHTAYFWRAKRDGAVFINYLEWTNEEDGGTNWTVLEKHRDAIQKGLVDSARNERARRKFVWMRDYHNHFCRTAWRVESEEDVPTSKFIQSLLVQPHRRAQHTFGRWGIKGRMSKTR